MVMKNILTAMQHFVNAGMRFSIALFVAKWHISTI